MEDLIVFEVGIRIESGEYSKFMESPNKKEVLDYLNILKETKPYSSELVFSEKRYRGISTTPVIVK